MSKWIRKEDTVVVITGNDKGRHGKVLTRRADKVVVEGINKRTKNIKRSQANPQGGRIQMEMPIHISNIALCDDEGNALKVRVIVTPQGEKQLLASKKGAEQFVLRTISKRSKAGA
jgi:large subunit ribosomal protein L24